MTNSSTAHRQYVPGALSQPRTTSTFDLQMLRDQVRRRELAQRMRQLREDSPYTQEAIADAIGLKLRSYQKAEQTGGISYEKLQALAKLHGVEFDWLLKGSDKGPAPDLLATMEPERSSDDRLERIEQELREMRSEREIYAEQIRELLAEQSSLLATIRDLVNRLGVPNGVTLQDHLEDQIGQVLQGFRETAAAGPPAPTTASADPETRRAT